MHFYLIAVLAVVMRISLIVQSFLLYLRLGWSGLEPIIYDSDH